MFELGIYGGVFFPARRHELYDTDDALPDQGFKPLRPVAPSLGLRAGYYPLRFLGLEAEGGAMPTRTEDDERAPLWNLRGHLVGQLGLSSVTPFVLLGTGAVAVNSARDALGRDVDLALHFGAGVKFYLHHNLALRLDVRDVVSARRGVDEGLAHSPEILLGLSVTLGRKRPAPPPDRDGDGFLDGNDTCPDEPGVAPDGCPVRDRDGDSFLDPDDACPDEPGVAPDGCPVRDRDRDGVIDAEDKCPDEPGVPPDGCPIRDTDGDRILDPQDKCPKEPETFNGFEDTDGCPDEIPEQVKAFSGTIEGIFFELNKATIRPQSRAVLDRAVEVLGEFPSIRMEISGHSDSTGTREHNLDLSARRAEAVKQHLVEHGIAPERLRTRGAGPDEPRADNAIEEGRQKNRRIEFKVLTD
jgi:OOP family OmpA-OmpF porin